jgi:hypothetical protein
VLGLGQTLFLSSGVSNSCKVTLESGVRKETVPSSRYLYTRKIHLQDMSCRLDRK